jgi:hypothetical protein
LVAFRVVVQAAVSSGKAKLQAQYDKREAELREVLTDSARLRAELDKATR